MPSRNQTHDVRRWEAARAIVILLALATGCARHGGADTSPVHAGNSAAGAAEKGPPAAPVTGNPLKGAKLFVDPNSHAMLNANAMRQSDPAAAATLDRIAQQPQALWMGDWDIDISSAVNHLVQRAKEANSVPILVAYNVPHRDAAAQDEGACHSCGGLSSADAYRRWIRNFHRGIGNNRAVVVLEPDALPGLDALPAKLQEERLFLLRDAIQVLRQNPRTIVYVDAGNPAWVPADKIANMLKRAGVEYAHGFAVNTSNYRSTEECLEYGHKVSALIGGKHFVIDTSRNGAGPYLEAKNDLESWCNPPGRKIGKPPSTDSGDAVVDAFLWLKRPGESDGECGGGPRAGAWWPEMAMQMAR